MRFVPVSMIADVLDGLGVPYTENDYEPLTKLTIAVPQQGPGAQPHWQWVIVISPDNITVHDDHDESCTADCFPRDAGIFAILALLSRYTYRELAIPWAD